ncbi:MAG: succinyl-diaminopimelate desuccinylase [Candidatus Woesebacteria bacterium GW2011_GWB1_39_12]|uniref:Succinyl-diaminopimelate desuccinylase n=2 Tax=Candidatus Woeseibacteriota TaxID=1752722 RepID=A0A0G0M6C4_9BACT|nr:MAG: succinyl-diaminopimelate desuccinylase [Candidatus Woesebacteria bacterium GW2011_GWA1_39_12]KKR01893.1 MAG: succinyl-diaminopimelate desuccinylase [Candidatus Woesebacteria bacterium GW2011_GWB1_39_12]
MKNKLIKELTTITKTLISFETISPKGDEYKCRNYVIDLFKKVGMRNKILYKNKKRTNIVGEIGKGEKSLLIACHLDTVPAGNGWKTDPFKATVKNRKIYGRGAIDDKGPFAISYCAIKKFVKDYQDFDGKIYLIALADEEADNIYGVKYLLSKGFKVDAALIPDGGYFSKLDIGEKGCVQVKIESFGKQEHSALVENEENALSNLTAAIENIKKIKWSRKFNRKFTPTKANFSIFHSGEIANTVPSHAYVQMDIRFPLGISSIEIISKIEETLKNVIGKFKINIIYKTEPHLVKNKLLINSFINAARNLGIKIIPITLAGNSVAKEFNQAGIPAIAHYPMEKITAHEPNEYIEIDKMFKTVEIYYEFFENYFNRKR